MKDVLLVGYGAVGAMYAFILKKSGQARVSVVARGNYEIVKAEGIHIKSRKYGEVKGWRPDRLFPTVQSALDRTYSYLVLSTKAIPEISRTPDLLAPLLSPPYSETHPQPTYVLLQNGLNVEADLYNALKQLRPNEEPKIISAAVWIATNMLAKNVVDHGNFERLSLGLYHPATDLAALNKNKDVLDDLASIISAGGSETTIVPDIQRVKFAKNLWNAVFGGSAALMRSPLADVFRPPDLAKSGGIPSPQTDDINVSTSYQKTSGVSSAAPLIAFNTIPFLYNALSELRTLGAVLFPSPSSSDAAIPDFEQDIALETLQRTSVANSTPHSTHRASMLADIENGRPMEVEVVLGELVRMGRAKGVDMPRIDTIYALLVVAQNQLLQNYASEKKNASL